MRTPYYRFGRFRLDPHSRELLEDGRRVELPVSTIDCLAYLVAHRDRPVGRDELAAAVWGRADVSEVSLTHAIMRLRRVLGDSGEEQRTIRTVPRLGYRWVREDTVEEEPSAPTPATDAPEPATSGVTTTTPRPRRRLALALAASLALIALTAALLFLRPSRDGQADAAPAPPALVLPVAVDAPADDAWVRLGLMDLIATRLRRGGVATAPSESVVALVNAGRPTAGLANASTLIVHPSAKHADGRWNIRLVAGDAQRTLSASGRSDDALRAARAATDELLIRLGRAPPVETADDAAIAADTLRQRVNAAVLAGRLDLARALIADAPAALTSNPEIALSAAKIDFYAGDYAKCREAVAALLDRLGPHATPALRARTGDLIGAALFRQGRIEEAGAAYAESLRQAQAIAKSDPDLVANAWLGLGGVASQQGHADEAAADYGRARTLLAAANDAFGVAAVDLNLGMIELKRGQPAAARETLGRARTRFESLAAEDALAATLVATAETDLERLDYDDARAVAAELEPLESRGGGQRPRWDVIAARARVLAATGRLAAADALVERIADASDAVEDAVARAQADAIAAAIAIARGDCAKSASLAARALAPALESHDAAQYAAAWRTRIDALGCTGDRDGARREAARLGDWSGGRSDLRARAIADLVAAGATDDAAAALTLGTEAMQSATRSGSADAEVEAGLATARRLIAAGRVDDAAAVSGRIAPYADRDARAATAQALVYAAMGDPTAAERARQRARKLAGERPIAPEKLATARTGG